MKKRNFILDFALKSKYNFLACVVALLVLIFSVSSITYAWIEGATQITIPASATVYSGTDKAIKITADTTNAKTISLDSYIDPQNVYLAPAAGAINSTTKLIDITFNSRPADTNDIGNNYLFFEAKVQCVGLVTDLAFDSSYIKIGESVPGDIRVGITLLDADRTALSSKIFTAKDVADGKTAAEGLAENGVYILQFKIWNETADAPAAGQELNIDLNLVPKKDVVTLKFEDFTNDATAQKLLSSKDLRIKYNGTEYSATSSSDGVYTYADVPSSQLSNIQFIAYDGSTQYASWSPNGFSKDVLTYRVYGDPSKSYGTFGTVQQVTVNDVSAGNILGSESVSVNNGLDSESYIMYKASTTEFTAYVPLADTTQNIAFLSETYTGGGTFNSATPVLNVYGHELPDADPNTLTPCVTEWSGAKPASLTTISIKDMSQGSVVKDLSVYASYGSLKTPYNAYFDAESNSWKITAISSYLASGSTGELWKFYAYEAGFTTSKYSWTDSNTNVRPLGVDASKTYYFTSSTEGTWEYKGSSIDPAILTDEKVSFYAGVDTGWSGSTGLYISESVTETESGITQSYKPPFLSVASSSRTYSSGYFTNVSSYNYYLKHKTTWKGIQIGEDAVAGKFYGLYNSSGDKIEPIDAVTGTTTIGTKSSSSPESPASVAITADENYTFQTNTNNYGKSLLRKKITDDQYADINLYVEYHICEKGQEASGFICLNPYISGDASSTMITSSDTDENTITTKVISLAGFDTAKTYTIKTVLTDGYIYYVSDTDYIKFTDASQNHTVTVYKPSTDNIAPGSAAVVDDSVDVKVTYNNTEYTGTKTGEVISEVNDGASISISTSVSNPKFNSYSVTSPIVYDSSDQVLSTSTSATVTGDVNVNAVVTQSTPEFIIGGERIDGIADNWNGSAPMQFNADNTLTKTIKLSSSTTDNWIQFKIVKGNDIGSNYRDSSDYCVSETGNFTDSQLICEDGITAEYTSDYQNIKITNLTTTQEINVTYRLGTGEIVLSDAGSTTEYTAVTITDPTNGKVSLTYNDTTYTSSNGTFNIPTGASVTLTCVPAQNPKFNSWQVNKFTQTVASGTGAEISTIPTDAGTISYEIPSDSVTISATMKQADTMKYYLTGNGIEGLNWGATEKVISDESNPYNKDDNTVSITVSANSDTPVFKISRDGSGENYRNKDQYSVTLNEPTVVPGDGITAALTGTDENRLVTVSSGVASGDQFTITYNLGTNTITVEKVNVDTTYNVAVNSADFAVITATYSDVSIAEDHNADVPENTTITLSGSSLANGCFVKQFVIEDSSGTVLNTLDVTDNSVTYNVTQDITVKTNVARRIYLRNSANKSNQYLWYWENDGTGYAQSDGYDYSTKHPVMTLLEGQTNIYYFDLINASINSDTFRFHKEESNHQKTLTADDISNNRFMYDNSTKSWVTYDPSSSGGGEASTFYLVGYIDDDNVSGIDSTRNFKTTATSGIYELTYTFKYSDKDQYLQIYDSSISKTYGPASNNFGWLTAGNYSDKLGVESGAEKWGIHRSSNTKVKITWDAANKKIKYEIVS